MIKLHSLSKEELIDLCRQKDLREAWDEFFLRYTRIMIRSIKAFFRDSKFGDLIKMDIVEDVYLNIVEKLYVKKALNALNDPSKLESWLNNIAANEAKSWLRNYLADKNKPRVLAESTALRLDGSLDQGQGGETGFHDIIEDKGAATPSRIERKKHTSDAANIVLLDMQRLTITQLWVLRLRILFYDPFSENDIEHLAWFLKKSYETVHLQVSELMDELIDRSKQKETDLSRVARLMAKLNHLERLLKKDLEHPELTEKERKVRADDIDQKRQTMNKLIRSGKQPVYSTNKEIGDILGIRSEATVSTLIFRARKKLIEKARIREKQTH